MGRTVFIDYGTEGREKEKREGERSRYIQRIFGKNFRYAFAAPCHSPFATRIFNTCEDTKSSDVLYILVNLEYFRGYSTVGTLYVATE
jgi:hypothetical protein